MAFISTVLLIMVMYSLLLSISL